MCDVPPVVVEHADAVEPQFGDCFGSGIEINDELYNEQYNELYSEQNTEPGFEHNNDPNPEMDNEANNDQADDLENMDKQPIQIQTRGRCVLGVSCTAPDMPRTFEVRHNVIASDSDNARTFVILGANSYLFGIEKIHRRHRQTSAVRIREVVVSRLQQKDGHLIHPNDIITDMKTMYGIYIMYSKAYHALYYALTLTYGIHEETFQLLTYFGFVLAQQNPSTITDLQCTDDGKVLYFFMSLRPSLSGFQREQNLDFTSFCTDYYKRETLVDAYSASIMHMGHPFLWLVPSDIAARVVLNPKSKRQSGHLIEGRHASSSERATMQSF
ncbi:hypothetical protein Ddye_012976 [Dipteronia dyeriana]|uniref:Uncharacterized protein n=1 Tax=Dipteronia dyeriana TaxID=168575 RepID=A0AAD9X5G0_9ROSI|nr:hypothetical protein Ddye_012976 [Dipteronia dyeriana]